MSFIILFTPLIAEEYVYFDTSPYPTPPVLDLPKEELDISPHQYLWWGDIPDPIVCSCINYLKTLGVTVSGYAGDIKANSIPKAGGVILLSYNEEHAAYIKELKTDGMVILEANFKPCQKSSRFIDYNDSHIRGYYDDTL